MKTIRVSYFLLFFLIISFTKVNVSDALEIDVFMQSQQSSIAYTIWLQNLQQNFKKHLYVCNKIKEDMELETSNDPDIYSVGRLGGRALPYWRTYVAGNILWNDLSYQEQIEIDAVTGASIQNTHTFSFDIETPPYRQFQICFEVDRSWNYNDWFRYSPIVDGFIYDNTSGKLGNQPAVLYSVDIDLDNLPADGKYSMVPIGWTPHEKNPAPGILTKDDIFSFFSEMRYITHTKNADGSFGDLDSLRATLIMLDEKIDVQIYLTNSAGGDGGGGGCFIATAAR